MVNLDGTVHIPGLGDQKKKMVLVVGVGAAAVAGVVIWRRRQAAASTAPSTAVDTTTTGIDPATGFSYGTPEDAAAIAAQSAYVQPTDLSGGGSPNTNVTGTTVNPIATNGQWTVAAEDFLTNTAGVDPGIASAALALYVNGENVTTDAAKSIIEQGIAAIGPAPVAGTNGYPPHIRTGTTSTTPPPVTAPVLPTVKNGYYQLLPSLTVFNVNDGKTRHQLTAATLKSLGGTASIKSRFGLTQILSDSAVMKLPLGSPV